MASPRDDLPWSAAIAVVLIVAVACVALLTCEGK